MLLECSCACVTILICTGKVDKSNIKGLISCIVDKSLKISNMSVLRRTEANLSANMALPCAWGMP